MENILEIRNLSKTYKDFRLNDISFELPKGYIMGFIGPNGAGKSTTIKLVMNLIKRDGGEIRIFGLDNIKNERQVKERVGFVYDENYYYEELTIAEMKRMVAAFYKSWDESSFQKYIKDFDLTPNKKIKELSKGMKTKFSLAVALSHNAELIIMDEPTSGLDPVFRSEILDILSGILQDENKSILFSTHITTDLDKIADFITFINKGGMVFSDPKDSILERYAVVKGGKELLNNDLEKKLVGTRQNSFGFEGLTDNIEEFRRLYGDKLLVERPSLEDIMVYTVKGGRQ